MKVIDILDFCIPPEDASYDELSDFADKIAELATDAIEAEPVKYGRWRETDSEEPCFYYCSNCGCAWDDETDYCPSCGAIMEKQ